MTLEVIKRAAFEVLTGRETAHSLKVLRDAQSGWEQVRDSDPETYHLVKRAMIERMKRQIRRAA